MRQPWHICLSSPFPKQARLNARGSGHPNIRAAAGRAKYFERWSLRGAGCVKWYGPLRAAQLRSFYSTLKTKSIHMRSVAWGGNWPSAVRKLTSGWFLISVGIVNGKTRSVRIYTNLDRGIVHSIHATAQMRKLSRFGFLAEAAQNKIKGRCKLLIKKFMGNVKWHLMCD